MLVRAANLLLAGAGALLLCACGGGGTALPAASWPGHLPDSVGMDYTASSTALKRLNVYRGLCGLPAVELDYLLSRGCQLHANYLAANRIDLGTVGLAAHEEDPGWPGFTVSGALAAQNSVIFQGVGPVEAVDKWFQTLYHRIGLLDPNLLRIGFGTHGEYQVLDIHQGRAHGAQMVASTVVYPAPGISNVPGVFKIEIPHPIPGDTDLGIPVTVEFYGPDSYSVNAVQTQLLRLDGAQVVPCYVQAPGDPFLPAWDYSYVIAMVPREPLKRGEYAANVQALVNGRPWSLEWNFSVR